MNSEDSRYFRAARRAQALSTDTTAKLARAAVAGAMLVVPVACGTGDEAAFSSATSVEAAEVAAQAATTAPAVEPDTAPTPTPLPVVTDATSSPAPTAIPATATATAVSADFPANAEMLVSFTYEPTETNRFKRPYVAVWIEDTEGTLISTVSLWFQQDRKGTNWLDDLAQWYNASEGSDTTMSSATRVPGDYTVAWDGTDMNGDPVAAGEYVLNIESSREHGPTSYTSGPITIAADGFTVELPDDGELSGAGAVLST